MKRFLILFSIAAGGLLASPLTLNAAPGPGSARFGFFYRSLRPHGEWIVINDGAYVWRPFRARPEWRPYLLGRWAWTDYGWYWVSREPFGWITYHYGRWYFDDYYGWVWIPDDEWGPSWVEFRATDDCVGWAPLPPYAGFSISFGIRFTREWVAPPAYWNVVRVGYFGNEIRYRDVQSPEYVTRFVGNTRVERNIGSVDDRVINRGIDPRFFEQHGNRRIERVDVQTRDDRPGETVSRGVPGRSDRIEVFRPRDDTPSEVPDRIEARRTDRRSSLDVDRFGTGRTGPNTQTPTRPPDAAPISPRRIGTPDNRPLSPPPTVNRPDQTDRRPRVREVPAPPADRRVDPRGQREKRRETMDRYERRAPSPPVDKKVSRAQPERATPQPAPQQPKTAKPERGPERRRIE